MLSAERTRPKKEEPITPTKGEMDSQNNKNDN
jgi:hypothetical protein